MSDQPPRHTFRNAGLGLLAAVVVSVTYWMTMPPLPAPASSGAASQPAGAAATDVAPPPAAGSLPVIAGLGGDFELPATTSSGAFRLADARGKVVLLNFGFTHCPDVCPMVLTRIGNALRELERQGENVSRVQSVFVTFDPERDALDQLREYVAYFYPTMIGLRGDVAQTASLARQYKVMYLRQDSNSASGYVFQHSDFVYVIDTYGRVRLLVGSKDPDAALVESVKRLLRDSAAENNASH